ARARGHHGRRRAGEVLLAHPAGDVGRDVAKDAADRAVRSGRHQRLAVAAAEADARVQGDRSEEGDVVRLGQATSAAAAEDVCRLPAVRAHEAAHVLDDAQDWHLDLRNISMPRLTSASETS